MSALIALDNNKNSSLPFFIKATNYYRDFYNLMDLLGIFSLCQLTVNILRGSPLSEYVEFVRVQGSFAVSRQIAGVIWEGDTLYAGGSLRAVQVVGPGNRPWAMF